LNVPYPIIKDGFVPPEIQRYLGPSRTPIEPFAEAQVWSHFLDPDEFDLKGAGGCRATAGVDGKNSGPFPQLVLCFRKADLPEGEDGLAGRNKAETPNTG
jgi:hypothetical protein